MILLVILLNVPRLWRETNSHAATARGVKSFQQQKYLEAAAAFAQANRIAPSPQRAFNLGTAQIASGNREQGSSTLARAMADRGLRGPPSTTTPIRPLACPCRLGVRRHQATSTPRDEPSAIVIGADPDVRPGLR